MTLGTASAADLTLPPDGAKTSYKADKPKLHALRHAKIARARIQVRPHDSIWGPLDWPKGAR